MSQSYDRLIDAALESLRAHILPTVNDDFARGQLFSVMFALNYMKLAGDWKREPLLQQIRVQDTLFEELSRRAKRSDWPEIPHAARNVENTIEALETSRDEGDRYIGRLLMWLTDNRDHKKIEDADAIEGLLRTAIRDQLKIELNLVPASMLSSIASGDKSSEN